jgi:hypothetical protein
VLKFVTKLPYLVAKIMNLFQDKYLLGMLIMCILNRGDCLCPLLLLYNKKVFFLGLGDSLDSHEITMLVFS